MTQDELSMHDCTKGLEDGCTCDRVKSDERLKIEAMIDESVGADVEDLTDEDF